MTGQIEDWQLSASSVRSSDHNCQVKYARLHQPGSRAWCAHDSGSGDSHWILVDLGVNTEVTGLLVQGRGDEMEWVTSFTVAMSQDAYKWEFVHDFYGKKKTFKGNADSHHIRTIWFDRPMDARFVRLHVLEWFRAPSLRLEVLGCQECSSLITGPGIGYGLTASTFASWAKKNSCQPDDAHVDSHRAWCSRHNNGHQWLQFDVGPPSTVTGVLTRGRGDTGRRHWVTSYTMSYSNDSTLWYYYKESNHLTPKLFGGNMDKSTERRHYFNNPFVARFVRLHPTTWHNHIAMRAALLGCPSRLCPPNFFRLNELGPCGVCTHVIINNRIPSVYNIHPHAQLILRDCQFTTLHCHDRLDALCSTS
ncbi:Lactadherin, partial [Orchesella cincta]